MLEKGGVCRRRGSSVAAFFPSTEGETDTESRHGTAGGSTDIMRADSVGLVHARSFAEASLEWGRDLGYGGTVTGLLLQKRVRGGCPEGHWYRPGLAG